jgi:hypothetical protein
MIVHLSGKWLRSFFCFFFSLVAGAGRAIDCTFALLGARHNLASSKILLSRAVDDSSSNLFLELGGQDWLAWTGMNLTG